MDSDIICVECSRLLVVSTVILWCLPSLFTSQECGPPRQIRYASIELSKDRQVASYRCERWYLFPDGNRTQDVRCIGGSWELLPGSCLPGLCAPEWTRYKTSCFQFRHQRQPFASASASCSMTSSIVNQSRIGLDENVEDHLMLAAMPRRSRYLNDVVEYFTSMISQYNRSAVATEDLSGKYWVNLFPAGERIRVRTDEGRRMVVPEGQAVALNINYTENGLDVDLVFADLSEEHNFLCEDHIYCPSISDEEDKTSIYADKMVLPHEDKSLCPNSQLDVICRDGLWRYLACSAPTVPVYTYTTCPVINVTLASYPTHDKNHVGSTVLVQCNSGYHFDDKSDFKRYTCNASGMWIPTMEYCRQDILCPPPTGPLFYVTCNTSLSVSFPMLTVRQCLCEEGRMFADAHKAKISVCKQDGKWDTEVGDGCTAFGTNCPAPPGLTNAVIIGSVEKSYHVNTSVYYICNDGMQFKDETRELSVVCPMDGIWRIPFEGCEEIPQTKRRIRKYHPPPVEAPGSSAIGSVAMIFVLIFMSGIFILDLINIKNALVMMFKNVRSFCRYYCITTRVKYTKTPTTLIPHNETMFESESDGEFEKSRSPSISSILSNHVGKYDSPRRDIAGAHVELLPNGFRDDLRLADDNSSSSQMSTKFEGESDMAAMSFRSDESLHDVEEVEDVHIEQNNTGGGHVTVDVKADDHVIGNGPDTSASVERVVMV